MTVRSGVPGGRDHRLPREVLALLHHVELNKRGWWTKAIDQFILVACWWAGEPIDIPGCTECLKKDLGLDIEQDLVASRVDSLTQRGKLVSVAGRRFSLSLTARNEVERELRSIEERQRRVQALYGDTLYRYDSRLPTEVPWERFEQEFLIPYVAAVGVQTYALLLGAELSRAATGSSAFQQVVQTLAPELRRSFTNAVLEFLDPTNADVRWHVLRLLSASLCLEACRLDAPSVTKISNITAPTFTFFLDTNCLFSLLGLHDNPANEAVQALAKVVRRVSTGVAVRLYVVPDTLEEARRVLSRHQKAFANVRRNMVAALREMLEAEGRGGLTGLAAGYLQRAKEDAQTSVAPGEYFQFYYENLLELARNSGVELFQADTKAYRNRQDVIDDILDQLERDKRERGARAKEYEALTHDMVLWHFAADRRPAACDSPLDAQYWVVTADFRLLGFDRFTMRNNGASCAVPVCLHPSSVLQLLQFWIPRTAELESAVVASLRLPVLFPSLDDSEAEATALTILETLGRFEDIEDLSPETIVRILVNKGLRERIATSPEVEDRVEAVREVLLAEHQARETELLRRLAEQTEDLETERKRRADLAHEVERLRRENEERERILQELGDRLKQLEAIREEGLKQRERWMFLCRWTIPWLVSTVGLGLLLGRLPLAFVQPPLGPALRFWAVVGVAIALWFIVVAWAGRGRAKDVVTGLALYKIICVGDRRLRSWLGALPGAVVIGLLVDVIASLLGW